MAIALQQGSAERESFLKELDNNLRDKSVKLEKALSAPAADDSWEFWISRRWWRQERSFFAHEGLTHATTAGCALFCEVTKSTGLCG